MRSLHIVLHFHETVARPGPDAMVEMFYTDAKHAKALYDRFLDAEFEYRKEHAEEKVLLRGRRYSMLAEPGKIFGEGKRL